MNDKGKIVESADELTVPVTYSPEAYISEDYARAERDRLWRKVWLQAGRVEDIPGVGDYLTYEILDDSVLIVRSSEQEIRAYHNVCPHRGRRLVDVPGGAKHGRDRRPQFTCGYHGWRFDLEGKNTNIIHKEDWQGQLTEACTSLRPVNVDTWSGWIWVNLDPNCEPLRDYLEPAASLLEPFELQNMRCRWRKWGIFDCNWKVAMEAFAETYHVETTHPEFNQFTPGDQVLKHWLESARRDDEARGVVWPTVDPAIVGKSGTAWQIFPNFQIGHSVNNSLCYSARPYRTNPDKCIFEAAVYQLYPEGEEPETDWEYCPATAEAWCYVLGQDFSNMAAVQQGMKSAGFSGPQPNPYMERSVANLHRNLAQYMGMGQVRKLK